MKTNTIIQNLNNLKDYFGEPAVILKMIHSIDINIDIAVDPIAAAGALLIGILNMDITSLLNPVAEISEEEKKRRTREFKLSDKLAAQIAENERRKINNEQLYTYASFSALFMFGHLNAREEGILAGIMEKNPSSHLRYTFTDKRYGVSYIICKKTGDRAYAD